MGFDTQDVQRIHLLCGEPDGDEHGQHWGSYDL